jgi:hypothetical protein
VARSVNCRWKTSDKVLLPNVRFGVIVAVLMNRLPAQFSSKLRQLFCLRFKRRLRSLLAKNYTPAEAFGPAWEQTLDAVALNDTEQAQAYWELIGWAGSGKLFTVSNTPDGAKPEPERSWTAPNSCTHRRYSLKSVRLHR